MKRIVVFLIACTISIFGSANRDLKAHDTWVETPSILALHNEWLYVDLRLGNHGNNHRDFKLASKITLAPCTITLICPNGERKDLKADLKDLGNAEKEGYWSARIVAEQLGLYQVVHTLDTLHGKTRAIKTSKTFFVSCDQTRDLTNITQPAPMGTGLEFQFETPITELQANKAVQLTLLWKGKPAPNVRVAFIPRGVTLSSGEDPNFERVSDQNGRVEFTPKEGNLVLAVAHQVAEDEKGENYDKTHYGATLVLPIPQRALK